MALTGPLSMGVATASALLQVLLAMCLSACLSVCLCVCLCVSLSLSAAVCRSVGLFVLFPLSCPAAPPALQRGLRRWAAAWLPRARGTRSGVGFTPLPERGSAGALREEGRGDQGWVRGRTTTSGLHACTHAPGSAPHCCGSRCTAVGSVAATCRLLASFLSFAAGG